MFQTDHPSPFAQESDGNLPKWLPPIALTSVAMKCFERLVMAHINTIMPETLDQLQFAYHPNSATDDAISNLDKRKPFY